MVPSNRHLAKIGLRMNGARKRIERLIQEKEDLSQIIKRGYLIKEGKKGESGENVELNRAEIRERRKRLTKVRLQLTKAQSEFRTYRDQLETGAKAQQAAITAEYADLKSKLKRNRKELILLGAAKKVLKEQVMNGGRQRITTISERLTNGERTRGIAQLTTLVSHEAEDAYHQATCSGVNMPRVMVKIANLVPEVLELAPSPRAKGEAIPMLTRLHD